MANAFFILGIVMAIFAVVAFDLFADRDGSFSRANFGTFSRAYFTMFQAPGARRRVCVLREKRGRPAPGGNHHGGC